MIKLKDIADKLGVSVSTVSKSLNDSSEISEEVKNKIKQVASELNYIPNYSAKVLAGGASKTIGIILPEISSNYYVQIIEHIGYILKTKGYSLILGITNHNFNDEIGFLNVFGNKKVDGIIISGSMHKKDDTQHFNIIKKYNIPMILVNTFISYPEYDYIMIDELHGITNAINYLKQLGHKHIGFIGDEVSTPLRFDYFKSALNQVGLTYYEKYCAFGEERFEFGGYLRMKELLESKNIPTAVFASYDNFAIGAIKAICDSGLTIPEGISIVGFDNIRESAYLTTPLTTISPPIKEMCQIGANLLLEKIQNKQQKLIQHISLKPELLIRKTACNIKQQ